jgi:hypothetical protein
MRIIVVVIGVIVLLVVCVVIIGALLPKRHVASRSASFRATPERIFSLIAGSQDWRPDVLRYEVVSRDGNREVVRETTRDEKTIAYEVFDSFPPKSIKRRIATDHLPYSGTWTYTLELRGETTVVRITEDGEVYNPLFRFISRFILGHTRSMDAYLRALGKATGQEARIED